LGHRLPTLQVGRVGIDQHAIDVENNGFAFQNSDLFDDFSNGLLEHRLATEFHTQ
jgi:hypothetical protein